MAGIDPRNIIPTGIQTVTRQFTKGGATANLTLAKAARSSVQTDVMVDILRDIGPDEERVAEGPSGHTYQITYRSIAIGHEDISPDTTNFVMKNESDLLAAIRTASDDTAMAMRFGFMNLLRSGVRYSARSVVVDMNYENPVVQEFMLKQLAAGVILFLGEVLKHDQAVIEGAFDVFAVTESEKFGALSTVLMDPEEVPSEVPPFEIAQGLHVTSSIEYRRSGLIDGEWVPVEDPHSPR